MNIRSGKIHNGFWFWKYAFITGLMIAYFYAIDLESENEGSC